MPVPLLKIATDTRVPGTAGVLRDENVAAHEATDRHRWRFSEWRKHTIPEENCAAVGVSISMSCWVSPV